MLHRRNLLTMLLLFCLCCHRIPASAEERAFLPSGIAVSEIESCSFDLPEGSLILDAAWIGGSKDRVLLLLGNPEADAVQLAVADLIAAGTYQLAAISKALLPYQGFEPAAGFMLDKWNDSHPSYWWGAGGPPTDREIYLSLSTNTNGDWYVSFGHVADANGVIQHAFWQEDPGSLMVSGETAYPQIRWRTDASLLLEDFDLAAIASVCRDALDFVEIIQRDSECLEYRIEEPGGNG